MRRRGFTITELLVVIAIVVTLAGLLLPVIRRAHLETLRVRCTNSLRQLHTGLTVYRDDYLAGGCELNPLRLTHLFALNKVHDDRCFVCPADDSMGESGGKPDGVDPRGNSIDQYQELDEPRAEPPGAADGVLPCSYMYEFAMAAPAFAGWETYVTLPPRASGREDAFVDLDGDPSWSAWGEVKTAQMRYGDTYLNQGLDPAAWRGYSPTRFPVARCFWHTEDPNSTDVNAILNLSYNGNVFPSEARWETASKIW